MFALGLNRRFFRRRLFRRDQPISRPAAIAPATTTARSAVTTRPAEPTTPKPACERARSLVELLQMQAELYGDSLAYQFFHDDTHESSLTFAQLEAQARAIGARLAQELSPGDRALLVYPPGLEFISAFFGCLYAGVVATPATYPKPRRPLPRMSRIAEDSGARVALTTAATLEAIDFDQQDDTARSLDWLATDELTNDAPATDAPAGWRPHNARADDLAFLQYTSGSTSEPKGVMVSHGNLLANLEAIRTAFGLATGPGPDDPNIGVFWLPAYHDMGLIGGVLTPMYVGGPSVLMPPPAFLQRPMRWLEALDKFKATISGAPDFAYRLCVERTTADQRAGLDLSHWRLAFCGAEPIHADTLTAFADAMEPAGFTPKAFYPCYGLAEATLLAAGPDSHQPPTILTIDRAELGAGRAVVAEANGEGRSQRLVGCGSAPAGHELLIVDPEPAADGALSLRTEGEVGEIVVSGPSVAQGYWRRQRESAETFGGHIAGRPASERVLRTGDLGFLHRGELFVTGRRKDVVILRGRNYYPQDLEQTAEAAHPLAMPGAAFSVQEDDTERLVLVCQIDRSCRGPDRPAVVEAIRRAILAEHEVDPLAVVLIRQGSLPVTSSGKVQRSLCRQQFLDGGLKTLHEWRSTPAKKREEPAKPPTPPAPPLEGLSVEAAAERIEEWMFVWLAERVDLDLTEADRNRPFAEQGLDSLTAVELSAELEDAFEVPLPPIVAWNYPTPAAMARYLAEETRAEETRPEGSLADDAVASADVEALLADIENLSEEEAERLLSEG